MPPFVMYRPASAWVGVCTLLSEYPPVLHHEAFLQPSHMLNVAPSHLDDHLSVYQTIEGSPYLWERIVYLCSIESCQGLPSYPSSIPLRGSGPSGGIGLVLLAHPESG